MNTMKNNKLEFIVLLTLCLLTGIESFSHVRNPLTGNPAIGIPSRPILSSRSTAIKTPVALVSTTSLKASPLDVMVTMYKDSLFDFPLETKLLTGAFLAFLGDAIAQSREPEYDSTRAGAFVTFDMIYRAVQCGLFPGIVKTCDGNHLASLLSAMSITPDLHVLSTLEQTFANQFIVIPIIYYPVFFTLTGTLQGLTTKENIERAKTSIVPLLKRNWLFWIPVQYFQFGYVDEPLQIPFLCVAGLAWTFILSAYAGSVEKTSAVVGAKETSSVKV